jgi:SAM-dependent methyltransferase
VPANTLTAVSAPAISASVRRRLEPRPWRANYLPLRTLATQLRATAARHLHGHTDLRLLDVGCGERPYETVFAPYVSEYIGADYTPGPTVDVVTPAEQLPFDDASFDVVLSSQALEHVDDPPAVARELGRVLRPGGVAFVSTPGVVDYHPNPDDYWRWTHAGLARLLHTTGNWSASEVWHNGGTGSAFAYLMARQAEIIGTRLPRNPLVPTFVGLLNVSFWQLDRLYLRLFPELPPKLSPNYLIVATRGS